jgi:predicted O-methyltransferase YrrM
LYLVRKVNWLFRIAERIKRSKDRQFRQLFRQMQFLHALQKELNFPKSLPPTGGIAASPDFLKSLADQVLTSKPKLVVECGSGMSTVVIARCLQLNRSGRIFSLEHLARFAEQTRDELERQDLSDWATVIHAPLRTYEFSGRAFQWYPVQDLPDEPVDLIVVDGPPASVGESPRYPAGPILFPRLSSEGAIFIDDAGRPEEASVIQKWRRQFTHLSFDTNTEDFEKGMCVSKVTHTKEPQSATSCLGR